ncbi:MAG: Trk family potassium uptake protein [Clostridia bacterium]|nr:Trk family potassium uptake protein [Clostridia bacterium]
MLPFASAEGERTSFLTALFTAVSASCVTGLVLVDTATHWTVFGQLVILFLIQTGGLGFITIATVFLSFARKNLGLKNRALMAESLNSDKIAGLKETTKRILRWTLIFEGAGTLLLSVPFIREFGALKGLYYAVFHSVSAFCNAGFDLMGVRGRFSSFETMSDDIIVNIVFMLLISIGGIGFYVWEDVRRNGLKFRRYALHTKLALTVSAILTFGGAILFLVFESGGVLTGVPLHKAILRSLFQSVTCRTAGFNTIDLGAISTPSLLLSCFLMFSGGSTGSTAGGIKTSTIAVVFIFLFTSLRARRRPMLFGRSLSDEAVKKASGVICFNAALIFIGAVIITAVQNLSLGDVLFETFSAMGTVGMTTGITRTLAPISKCVIIVLMFFGRVGSVTLASAFFEKRAEPRVMYPVEEISIG